MKNYGTYIKPFLDFSISLIAIVLLSPIFICIITILFLFNNGHIFFKQKRPGKDGKLFTIVKFKTMTDSTDALGNLLPDEQRTSALGKFLRKYSLDELPQLFNVLAGNMSLVGPRPLLPEYLPLYSDMQQKRHTVKPGITGWAQIHGRNLLSWQQKFNYDVWYTEHISFMLDSKIIFISFKHIFAAKGINDGNNKSMEKFKGN